MFPAEGACRKRLRAAPKSSPCVSCSPHGKNRRLRAMIATSSHPVRKARDEVSKDDPNGSHPVPRSLSENLPVSWPGHWVSSGLRPLRPRPEPSAHTVPLNSRRHRCSTARSSAGCASGRSVATPPRPSPGLVTGTGGCPEATSSGRTPARRSASAPRRGPGRSLVRSLSSHPSPWRHDSDEAAAGSEATDSS